MKLVKFLFKTLLWIVALVVLALLTLPLWFGPVVKTAANIAVPKVVKTDFNLAHLSLNPYTARFELGGLVLANPAGYDEKTAAKVGELTFDAETLSLATDVIHIEEITLKDVFVSYVNGGPEKINNFQQIQYNVAGGKEKYEAAQAAKEEQAKLDELQAKETAQESREPEPVEEKPAKKVIIDKLTISGIKVQLGIIPLKVPVDICLTDIGRDSGGATLEEVWQQIWNSILKAAGALGDQLKALGNLTGDTIGKTAEAATKVTAQATETAAKVTESTTKAVGDAAGAATKAASDATKAAGDAAGKALDSLKSLW